MIAFGWVRVVQNYFRKQQRPSRRNAQKPAAAIQVERLEAHVLLNAARPVAAALHAHRDVRALHPAWEQPAHSIRLDAPAPGALRLRLNAIPIAPIAPEPQPVMPISAAQTLPMPTQTITQVIAVPPTLTPFTQPLAPPLNLFNPALGTLQSVTISGVGAIASQIQTQNTSTESGSAITAHFDGTVTLTGLTATPLTTSVSRTEGPVLVGPNNPPSPVFNPNPPVGHTFNEVAANSFMNASGNTQIVLTDPASLQFFTASAGRTTLAPTLTATATATATAPNGNLTTRVTTGASGEATVTYTYSTCPPAPVLTKVTILGVHMQPTRLVVQFQGQVNPAEAANPANYQLVSTGPHAHPIRIVNAFYDAATNSVTLIPINHLNVHFLYNLTANLQNISVCGNGTTQTITFGTRKDVGPIINHNGEIFMVTPTGPLRFIRIG